MSVDVILQQGLFLLYFAGSLNDMLRSHIIMRHTSVIVIIYISCLVALSGIANAGMHKDAAVDVLDKYLQLRLNDADWKEYSKLTHGPTNQAGTVNGLLKTIKSERKQNCTMPPSSQSHTLVLDSFVTITRLKLDENL
jgi:hypothetical protein